MTYSEQDNRQNHHENRIKKLPPLLVNQLAAGEVVTRPAAVVKELVENAIDAGATEITIRITQGGMGVIEVCDNGSGIYPDDMVMAVTRFATSKVMDVAHLQGISTLGFRGEALAATAAGSRLTLKSSHNNSGVGREINIAGVLEDTPELAPIVHPQGTTVTVKDLYFNVPARRGNLKSISTEFTHIESVVKQLALAASYITISLWHNDKRRFNFAAIYPSNQSLAQPAYQINHYNHNEAAKAVLSRLQMILPSFKVTSDSLAEKSHKFINISLEGLMSSHDLQQNLTFTTQSISEYGISGFLLSRVQPLSSAVPKLIYINGRLVKDTHIAQALRTCLASLQIEQNENSINELGYALFFELPTPWLNLNVHPSKQNIKVQNLANIIAYLKVGIGDALQAWIKQQPVKSLPLKGENKEPEAVLEHSNKGRSVLDNLDACNNLYNQKLQVSENKTPYQVCKKSEHTKLKPSTNEASVNVQAKNEITKTLLSEPYSSLPRCLYVLSADTANLDVISLKSSDAASIDLQGATLVLMQMGDHVVVVTQKCLVDYFLCLNIDVSDLYHLNNSQKQTYWNIQIENLYHSQIDMTTAKKVKCIVADIEACLVEKALVSLSFEALMRLLIES